MRPQGQRTYADAMVRRGFGRICWSCLVQPAVACHHGDSIAAVIADSVSCTVECKSVPWQPLAFPGCPAICQAGFAPAICLGAAAFGTLEGQGQGMHGA